MRIVVRVFVIMVLSLLMLFYSPLTEPKSAATLVKYIDEGDLNELTLEIYENPWDCSIIPMNSKDLVKSVVAEQDYSEYKTVVKGEMLAEKSFEITKLADFALADLKNSKEKCHGHVLSYCAFKNKLGKTIFDFSMPYFDSDDNPKILVNGIYIDYADDYEEFLKLFANG